MIFISLPFLNLLLLRQYLPLLTCPSLLLLCSVTIPSPSTPSPPTPPPPFLPFPHHYSAPPPISPPPPPGEQKVESWVKPLVDLTVKEGKEKIAKFEGEFSKKDSKPKWFFKKDVSLDCFIFIIQLSHLAEW